jgi:hypothetical protein
MEYLFKKWGVEGVWAGSTTTTLVEALKEFSETEKWSFGMFHFLEKRKKRQREREGRETVSAESGLKWGRFETRFCVLG